MTTYAPLAQTDPEFAASFGAFALDEIPAESSLDAALSLQCQLGAVIAVGAHAHFRRLAPAALDAGVTPVELKEITYQAVAYVGAARALDFVELATEVLRERGVELPLPGQSTVTPETRMEVGRTRQGELVGHDRVDAMYANAPADALRFQRFLSGNCFGDTYTRTGLDGQQREFLTFAMLAALGGADAQVRGHVAANLHVGNTRAQLLDVITILLPLIGYPRTLNALAAINEVAPPAE